MARGHSKKRSFFKFLMLGINLIFVACLVMSYLAAWISPAKYWLFAFFGITYPFFLLANIFFLVFWLLLWKKYIFFSLFAILLGYQYIRAALPLNFSKKTETPANTIKILSFNVHSLYGKTNRNYNPKTPSKVMELIAGEKPDILCIQEFYVVGQDYSKVIESFSNRIGLDQYFLGNYLSYTEKKRINAMAIFSKFPIVRTGTIRFRDKSLMAVYTDQLINSDTVRIYNLHLESFRFGNEDYSFYSHLTEPSNEKVRLTEGSSKIFGKLKKAFIQRAEQVGILQLEIKKCPYPLMICGDFNDTPFSYTYNTLSKGMNDSYIKAGKGIFGNTYAGSFPSFRIDYILFDENFEAFNYRKINTDLSDHNPISVYLRYSR